MQLTTALVAGLLSASSALARNIPRAYPGLTEEQSRNAGAAIYEIHQYGLGRHACLAVISTALQESELLVYANNAVPESLQYPHNRVGGDADSVGMFQQRKTYYPDVRKDMDPAASTGQFLDRMLAVPGWQSMEVSALDQAVQHAAAGNLYGKRIPLAKKVCQAAGF